MKSSFTTGKHKVDIGAITRGVTPAAPCQWKQCTHCRALKGYQPQATRRPPASPQRRASTAKRHAEGAGDAHVTLGAGVAGGT